MSNVTGNKRTTRSREVDDNTPNSKKSTTSIIDDSPINSNYQLTFCNYSPDLDVIQASTTGDQEDDAGYDSPAPQFRKHVRLQFGQILQENWGSYNDPFLTDNCPFSPCYPTIMFQKLALPNNLTL